MRRTKWWIACAMLGIGLAALIPGPPSSAQRAKADRWRAWAITAGPDTRLTVEGLSGNGGPCTVVVVKPPAPQGINPKVLMLDVKVGTLPGIWPAISYPVPASYTVSPYKAAQYTSVHLKYPDGSSIMIDTI